jgi:hypothetical protein
MESSATPLRQKFVATALVLGLLLLTWWGVWSIAAEQYRRVLDGWIESGRAAGYDISYDSRVFFGFPRRMVFRFKNVKWKSTDNIEFHAEDIDISAIPWEWQSFNARFKKRVQITVPVENTEQALILGGENGRAHVDLDKDGYWKFSRISLTNAAIGRTPDYVFLANTLQASAKRPDDEPKNHTETGLTLTGIVDNVTLPAAIPSPFGPVMTKLDIALRVMNFVPDFRKKESVAAWNKDMGVVEFDNLFMAWGPLALQAKGTMGFDDDLQPEGAYASTIGNHQTVLKALMDNGFIAAQQNAMLNSALSLFAKPATVDNVSGIEVPITVQLGGLFFGPVKIYTIPEIVWP